MLDEWAADQDPSYRRMFYHELLPELRALGKTIICVSHDDRYFALADRVIQMDGGRIASLRPGATHDAGYEHTAP
jgi:ABC-type siderophore export system fused ATPase/permease subunit